MKLLKTLLLAFLSCVLSVSYAQDIHYSQFNMSPLTLNPAITGDFYGTFRIGGLYRDQWASLIENQFVRPSIYLDAPIVQGRRGRNWVGAGVMLFSDKAGTASLTNLTSMLSLSYHMRFGEAKNTKFSIGAQGGIVQRSIDRDQLRFEDELISGNTSVDVGNITEPTISYPDFQLGALFSTKIASTTLIKLGYSLHHLTQPEDAFLANSERLPMRHTVHGGVDVGLGTKWALTPTFIFQSHSGVSEIDVQALLGYYLAEDKSIALNFGGGYRLADAAVAMIGLDLKGLKVGLAYDINTSSLQNVSGGRGGFEIAAYYIYRRKVRVKVPNYPPYCPRF